jgi:hypothetical protein
MAGSDKLRLSDKIITLTAINSDDYVHKQLPLFVRRTNFNSGLNVESFEKPAGTQ